MTSRKTSQGPQKSITTAPCEITNATGIGGDGFNRLELLPSESLADAALVSAKKRSAARKPTFVARERNSLLLIASADVFMRALSGIYALAAMTTIIKFLPGVFAPLNHLFRVTVGCAVQRLPKVATLQVGKKRIHLNRPSGST